jgi:Domain of unknown function (DUF4388)
MKNGRFTVLTGHLNDYPLSDLVGILRHQRKTGRLLIEYPKGPAIFYFQAGELVDAQLEDLSGLQAICVALAQPAASFNFNPFIQPARRSIENSLQRAVSELLGCWDENDLQIDTTVTARTLPAPSPLVLPAATSIEPGGLEVRALPTTLAQRSSMNPGRMTLVMAAAGLMMLGLSTVIAVTGRLVRSPSSAAAKSSPSGNVARPVSENEERSSSPAQAESRPDLLVRHEGQRPQNGQSAFEPGRRREGPGSDKKGKKTVSDGSPETASETKPTIDKEGDQKNNQGGSEISPVKVTMQIENGRVVQASIANHRAGLDSYEAMALRIARQRRYPSKTTGQESVVIKVSSPD